jgi:acyl-CoA thioester hydrolase
MPSEFKVVRRVEFSDTDMAGIMHFSNFFRFMETAEHAFLRALGFSVALGDTAPGLCLPRVHAECDYRAPLRFEDEVEIHLVVGRKSARSITWQFRFRRLQNGEPGPEVARGAMTVVCAARGPDGALQAAPLPQAVFGRIHAVPGAAPRPGRQRRK